MDELSVKAVSLITGISAHTLRAWENRYGAVEPRRSVTGRRVYNRDDVARLKLLKHLVDQGHSIGRIAALPLSQLESMAVFEPPGGVATVDARGASENPFVDRIINRIAAFDLPEVYNLVQLSQHHFPLREFVLDVISPVFRRVGEMVMSGRMDISQEHAFSAIMRHYLGGVLYSIQSRPRLGSRRSLEAPVLAFATPEGELHEFGILLAAMLAALHGCQIAYFGPNLPAESASVAAKAMGAQLFVLGASNNGVRGADSLRRYIECLDAVLPAGVEVWAGGEPSKGLDLGIVRRPVHPLADLRAFDSALGRWLAVARVAPVGV